MASSRVLNSEGRKLMMSMALGGGTRMLSMPWMTPLVPNWMNELVKI